MGILYFQGIGYGIPIYEMISFGEDGDYSQFWEFVDAKPDKDEMENEWRVVEEKLPGFLKPHVVDLAQIINNNTGVFSRTVLWEWYNDSFYDHKDASMFDPRVQLMKEKNISDTASRV